MAEQLTNGKGLVRVKEAAAFLSLSTPMIYKLMSQGNLPSVKIGRSRRIAQEALDALKNGLQPVFPVSARKSKRGRN